jgi:hypothetical protein
MVLSKLERFDEALASFRVLGQKPLEILRQE